MLDLSSELLKVIVCPITKKPLKYDRQAQELISEEAGLAFPVKDGIPILLVDKARQLKSNASYEDRIKSNSEMIENKEYI